MIITTQEAIQAACNHSMVIGAIMGASGVAIVQYFIAIQRDKKAGK